VERDVGRSHPAVHPAVGTLGLPAGALVTLVRRLVWHACGGTTHDFNDAVQETLRRVLEVDAGRYDGTRPLAPFLALRARWTVRDLRRQEARRARLEAHAVSIGAPAVEREAPPTPADVLEARERDSVRGAMVAKFPAALASLPDSQRAVLYGHDVGGRSLRALAKQEGVNVSTLSRRRALGLGRLRDAVLRLGALVGFAPALRFPLTVVSTTVGVGAPAAARAACRVDRAAAHCAAWSLPFDRAGELEGRDSQGVHVRGPCDQDLERLLRRSLPDARSVRSRFNARARGLQPGIDQVDDSDPLQDGGAVDHLDNGGTRRRRLHNDPLDVPGLAQRRDRGLPRPAMDTPARAGAHMGSEGKKQPGATRPCVQVPERHAPLKAGGGLAQPILAVSLERHADRTRRGVVNMSGALCMSTLIRLGDGGERFAMPVRWQATAWANPQVHPDRAENRLDRVHVVNRRVCIVPERVEHVGSSVQGEAEPDGVLCDLRAIERVPTQRMPDARPWLALSVVLDLDDASRKSMHVDERGQTRVRSHEHMIGVAFARAAEKAGAPQQIALGILRAPAAPSAVPFCPRVRHVAGYHSQARCVP
jgi:RNA polymerase sigma factor (sigma-70 family)